MKKEMKYFIVEEDDGVYNIFCVDDFDLYFQPNPLH